ncbi:MAG: DUF3450 family protein [Pseudomonadales bacterium]|nr:DUF3450 family protein [Pseudomonadales bacterium]
MRIIAQLGHGRFLFLVLLAMLPGTAGFSAETAAADLQKLMLDWTALERQKDRLISNWHQQQPILEQQLYLLAKEQEELRALLENTAQNQDEVEARRLQLLQEQTAVEQQQRYLEQGLNSAIAHIDRLYPQLPPPMSMVWQDQLPALHDEQLSSSERLQEVIAMLTSLHDFQQKISLHETLMALDEGSPPYLVRQVYLGLSHGWYVSADGSRAGHGSIGPEGWHWQPGADGEIVSRLIAILDGRQPPALLSVPVVLSTPAAQNFENFEQSQ